jgi:hypothetical protein
MIKIIDKRDRTIKELPTLPFMTQFDGDLYLYYEDTEENIACIDMSTGEAQIATFVNVRAAVDALGTSEQIVEVELYIIK